MDGNKVPNNRMDSKIAAPMLTLLQSYLSTAPH